MGFEKFTGRTGVVSHSSKKIKKPDPVRSLNITQREVSKSVEIARFLSLIAHFSCLNVARNIDEFPWKSQKVFSCLHYTFQCLFFVINLRHRKINLALSRSRERAHKTIQLLWVAWLAEW